MLQRSGSPRAPRGAGRPPDDQLCRAIVESLETAVMVVDPACSRLLHANETALTVLRAFGGTIDGVPPAFRGILERWLASTPPQARFRESLRITAPNGELYYLRAKELDADPSRLLLVMTPHVVRRRDLRDHLHARFGLSAREVQVVEALRAGLTNSEISARLGLSEGTVKNYLSRVFAALHVHSRTQLLTFLESLALDGGQSSPVVTHGVEREAAEVDDDTNERLRSRACAERRA